MTGLQAKQIVRQYKKKIWGERILGNMLDDQIMYGLGSMAARMEEIPDEEERKLMRWLGFIQEILYCHHVYSIPQMKEHNKTGMVT